MYYTLPNAHQPIHIFLRLGGSRASPIDRRDGRAMVGLIRQWPSLFKCCKTETCDMHMSPIFVGQRLGIGTGRNTRPATDRGPDRFGLKSGSVYTKLCGDIDRIFVDGDKWILRNVFSAIFCGVVEAF